MVTGGDFNIVIHKEERLGSGLSSRKREMEDFRAFIEEMDMLDMSCISGKFTWFNGSKTTMSRLDRFLLSSNIISDSSIFSKRNDGKIKVEGRGDFILYEKLKVMKIKLR